MEGLTTKLKLLALSLSLGLGFAHPAAHAEAPDCAALYRLLGRIPLATPAATEIEQGWANAFKKLPGASSPATPSILTRQRSSAERVAAVEARLPRDPAALSTQAEQLLEIRAQVARQGAFLSDEMDEWHRALELRNRRSGLIPEDPDGPTFLEGAKRYSRLEEAERLAWFRLHARSEHPEALATFARLYASEPSPDLRESFRLLALDRGIPLDSTRLARDLYDDVKAGVPIASLPRYRAELASLNSAHRTAVLKALPPEVAAHFREAPMPKRPLPTLSAATPEDRIRVLNAAPREQEWDILQKAFLDPVAEVRLAAVARLSPDTLLLPGVRRELRRLHSGEESLSVRREISARLDQFSRAIAGRVPSRTWSLDRLRRRLPTYLKLPPEKARDMELMLTASHIYDAPELDAAKSAADLVQQHRRFLGSIPADYEVSYLVTDPATGFKAGIYRPTSSARRDLPVVVAIGGTQTGKDLAADLNWGLSQAGSAAYRQLLARVQQVIAQEGREVAVTGHSLGGGLAQVLGYDLTRSAPSAAARVRVVSWNGFGAKEALQRLGRWTDADGARVRGVSYFHPQDPISKLGTHLGETWALEAVASHTRGGVRGLKESHAIKAVKDLFQMERALHQAKPAKPAKDLTLVRALEKFSRVSGPVTDKLLSLRNTSARRRANLHTLAEARHLWQREEGFRELKPNYDWLRDEIAQAAAELSGEAERAQALGAIREMEVQLEALRREQQRR